MYTARNDNYHWKQLVLVHSVDGDTVVYTPAGLASGVDWLDAPRMVAKAVDGRFSISIKHGGSQDLYVDLNATSEDFYEFRRSGRRAPKGWDEEPSALS
jgi:hypothetical protein